ncbi:hypothetical protein FA15DRAFT_408948 [Coprinopsis marcescibilis]|uniref:MYND-type domain-containing protein n=1 Tax=Coprinopsis marcescibilis TaxID=230819 RepID=A0A5C3KW40_COPMA|nr:hypothetical protein FA15DRAFT_408948 [Coprinopsis marcescibilis]
MVDLTSRAQNWALAEQGSIPHLKVILIKWPTREHEAQRLWKILFKFLDKELIPDIEEYEQDLGDSRINVERALIALDGLVDATDHLPLFVGPHGPTPTCNIIVEHTDGLISWMKSVFRHYAPKTDQKDHYRTIIEKFSKILLLISRTRNILEAMDGGSPIQLAMLKSYSMLDLILTMWAAINPETQVFFPPYSIDRRTTSYLLELFEFYIFSDKSRALLFEEMDAWPKSTTDAFATSCIYRLQQLHQGFSDTNVEVKAACPGTFTLLAPTLLILAANKRMRRRFIRCRYLYYCAMCLYLCLHPTSEPVSPKNEDHLRMAQGLVEHLMGNPDIIVLGTRQLIEGRVVTMLAEGLSYPAWELETVYQTMMKLLAQSAFQGVAFKFYQLFEADPLPTPVREGHDAQVKGFKDDFVRTGMIMFTVADQTRDEASLCDNLEHREYMPNQIRTRPQTPSRYCSGCHSVLYCSRTCQKVDWKARHRDECTRARRKWRENAADRIVFRPLTRKMLQTIAVFYVDVLFREGRTAVDTGSYVFAIDFRAVPPGKQYIPFDEFLARPEFSLATSNTPRKSKRKSTREVGRPTKDKKAEEWYAQRVRTLIESSRDTGDRSVFADITTTYGLHEVRTFAKLVRKSEEWDSSYIVGNSVVRRHVYPPSPPLTPMQELQAQLDLAQHLIDRGK